MQRGPCGTLYAVTDIFDHNSAGPDGVANRAPIRHTENTMRTGAANPVNFDRVDDEGRGVTELMTPGGDALSWHVDEEDKLARQFDGSGVRDSRTPIRGSIPRNRNRNRNHHRKTATESKQQETVSNDK